MHSSFHGLEKKWIDNVLNDDDDNDNHWYIEK